MKTRQVAPAAGRSATVGGWAGGEKNGSSASAHARRVGQGGGARRRGGPAADTSAGRGQQPARQTGKATGVYTWDRGVRQNRKGVCGWAETRLGKDLKKVTRRGREGLGPIPGAGMDASRGVQRARGNAGGKGAEGEKGDAGGGTRAGGDGGGTTHARARSEDRGPPGGGERNEQGRVQSTAGVGNERYAWHAKSHQTERAKSHQTERGARLAMRAGRLSRSSGLGWGTACRCLPWPARQQRWQAP